MALRRAPSCYGSLIKTLEDAATDLRLLDTVAQHIDNKKFDHTLQQKSHPDRRALYYIIAREPLLPLLKPALEDFLRVDADPQEHNTEGFSLVCSAVSHHSYASTKTVFTIYKKLIDHYPSDARDAVILTK